MSSVAAAANHQRQRRGDPEPVGNRAGDRRPAVDDLKQHAAEGRDGGHRETRAEDESDAAQAAAAHARQAREM